MGMQFYTKYNVNILEIYGLKLFFLFVWLFSPIFTRRTYIKIFKSQNNLVHPLYHGNADEHAILQEL